VISFEPGDIVEVENLVNQPPLIVRFAGLALLVSAAAAYAQSTEALEEHVIGVWRMDPRTLHSPGVVYYQEDGTVSIMEQRDDGTFRVMSRVTTRAVAETDDLLLRPGCVGKTECVYDDATEGIGTLYRNTIYIDWLDDEGWIDDLLTIDGDEMTGDDGNGPIRLVKED
jgi:hypothetical protein